MFGSEEHHGGVIWVCGLAGVGKTTFARFVGDRLVQHGKRVSAIDGDAFRRNVVPYAGYDRESRLSVARAITDQAWRDAEEGVQCVVATISLMHEIHMENAERAARLSLPLRTVLVEAPLVLRERTRGRLYGTGMTNVVGRGILPEYPVKIALRVNNAGSLSDLQRLANRWVDETYLRAYAP